MSRATLSQATVLMALARLTRERGYPPTYKEIADVLGRNAMTISKHLGSLARKGLVSHTPNRARSTLVTDAGAAELGGSHAP